MRSFLTAAVLLCGLTGAGLAKETILDCKMRVGAANGFVTERYILWHEDGAGEGKVLDGIIQHFKGGEIAAKVKDEAKRKTFSWKVQVTNSAGQQAPLTFTAAVIKASMEVHVSARVGGGAYIGDEQASGTCVAE